MMQARKIIEAFGGVAKLQKALGNNPDGTPKYHFSTIYHWWEKDKIPSPKTRNPAADVAAAARENGIKLGADA